MIHPAKPKPHEWLLQFPGPNKSFCSAVQSVQPLVLQDDPSYNLFWESAPTAHAFADDDDPRNPRAINAYQNTGWYEQVVAKMYANMLAIPTHFVGCVHDVDPGNTRNSFCIGQIRFLVGSMKRSSRTGS